MKILLGIILIILLSSCEENLITRTYHPSFNKESYNDGYEIVKIESHHVKGLSTYYLDSRHNWMYFKDKIYLVDSINKYQIGDKVYITLEKVNP